MKYFLSISILIVCCNQNNQKFNKSVNNRPLKTEFYQCNNFFILINNKTMYSNFPFNNQLKQMDSFDLLFRNDKYSFYKNDSVYKIISDNEKYIHKKLKLRNILRDIDSISFVKYLEMYSEIQNTYFIEGYSGVFDFVNCITKDYISGKIMKLENDDKVILKDFVDFVDFKIENNYKYIKNDTLHNYLYILHNNEKNYYLTSNNKLFENVMTLFLLKYEFDFLSFATEAKNQHEKIKFNTRQRPF